MRMRPTMITAIKERMPFVVSSIVRTFDLINGSKYFSRNWSCLSNGFSNLFSGSTPTGSRQRNFAIICIDALHFNAFISTFVFSVVEKKKTLASDKRPDKTNFICIRLDNIVIAYTSQILLNNWFWIRLMEQIRLIQNHFRTNSENYVACRYGTRRPYDVAKMTRTMDMTVVMKAQVASIPHAAYKLVTQSGHNMRATAVPAPKRPVQVPCFISWIIFLKKIQLFNN